MAVKKMVTNIMTDSGNVLLYTVLCTVYNGGVQVFTVIYLLQYWYICSVMYMPHTV